MARLKAVRTVHGAVPAELTNTDATTWHDPAAFTRWCAREGVEGPANVHTWAERFMAGLAGWAKVNGVDNLHDRANLAELGIPFVGSLDRARARIELDNQ